MRRFERSLVQDIRAAGGFPITGPGPTAAHDILISRLDPGHVLAATCYVNGSAQVVEVEDADRHAALCSAVVSSDPALNRHKPKPKSVPAHQEKAEQLAFFLLRLEKLKSGEAQPPAHFSIRAGNDWVRNKMSEYSSEVHFAKSHLRQAMDAANVRTVKSGIYTFAVTSSGQLEIHEHRASLAGGRGEPTAGHATVLGVPIPKRTLDTLVNQKRRLQSPTARPDVARLKADGRQPGQAAPPPRDALRGGR